MRPDAPAEQSSRFSLAVVIPTLNRADSLARTLATLLPQAAGNGAQVIVVDNGSTDSTAAVVERLAAGDERLRYVLCREPGAHFARNLGAQLAQAPVVAFVDDDVLSEPDWLAEVSRTFRDQGVACAGGRVDPLWEAPPPAWISQHLSKLAILDRGDALRDLHPPEDVYSCNFAVRRDWLLRVGGFNPDIAGDRFVGDGETGLLYKLWGAGARVVYAPAMRVRHVIPKARLSEDYLRARFRNQGIADACTGFRRSSSRGRLAVQTFLLGIAAAGYAVGAILFSVLPGRARHCRLYRGYCAERLRCTWNLFRSAAMRSLVRRDDWLVPLTGDGRNYCATRVHA